MGVFDWCQFRKRWTWKARNLCLIDHQSLKTAGLAGLEGLPNLVLSLEKFPSLLAFNVHFFFTFVN